MGAALVIHPDGDLVEVNLKPDADKLALMRAHLDCRLVDCVALTSHMDMWIDDEGLDTKSLNPVATAIAGRFGLTWQGYHGAALLCGVDAEGGSVDLTRDQIIGLLTHLSDLVDRI